MVYYLSLEFLLGRALRNALYNLELKDDYASAILDLGYQMEDLYDMEPDAGLGNGGLGRLAACFMDSLATLNYPGWGYGIRYHYGMFEQVIRDGYQIERPDYWLRRGNPWEIERSDLEYDIRFYGHVVEMSNGQKLWDGGETIVAVAYDNPIPGFRTRNCLNIRLWSARPSTEFHLEEFNKGDYLGAVRNQLVAEQITAVLYPNDNTDAGKELRLKQQYFFVSATIQDIIRRYKESSPNGERDLKGLPEKVSIQLNDTHPTIGISELMRILLDVEDFEYDEAWELTRRVFSYTNHTVLPEALEKWSVPLMERLLPRHMQIIYLINHKLMMEIDKKFPGDIDRMRGMSIIEESTPKQVRMAQLAVVGSHTVNGVAKIHSDIVRTRLFQHYAELWPTKFQNKTNGVTPRRWMVQANPALSRVLTKYMGSDEWITDLDKLQTLWSLADDEQLQNDFMAAKKGNKLSVCNYLYDTFGVQVNPNALFDVQIKRIHEYKRQLLNVLAIIHRYITIKEMTEDQKKKMVPKVYIFGGKAAAGYQMAKNIIRLINGVADMVNNDPDVGDLIKVFFVPNYCVSLAELIIPASDVSQHISTAGMEASGTSNMKFVMNGGLIVGTMDGANIEIREEVGADNMFIFGTLAEDVDRARFENSFRKTELDPRLKRVLDKIGHNIFAPPHVSQSVLNVLAPGHDYYLIGKDFPSYIDAMDATDRDFADKKGWARKCIRAVTNMGKFSSDRCMKEYAQEIWHIHPHPSPVPERRDSIW
eukprot:TRINITY_DN2167_c0_g1::TRINITY_DN2167_c0_g1_i1::g.12699::m.12699 TRINITY_DN2167_c0_g1::TRINITY_DN2167_c0_g1_i1::g.12699  ORF type:complete len:869 (-),score=334.73,sp/Q00766/PHS1_DICDI/54.12/0.0,Phosphorylase/PF00343.15/0,DUF4368/PF14287.1/0.25 TRINITY_DN2167_c0_g1_i1:226-2508(-)